MNETETLFEYHGGLHLRDTILWMDTPRPRSLCFISHAGMPEALGHHKVVSTALTAEILRSMAAIYGRGTRAHEPQALVTPYGRTFLLGQLSLELFPSGHMLGSASLLLKHHGKTIVYAGDVNLRRSPLVDSVEARPCDVLVLPARFGQRRWSLPPEEETTEALLSFVRQALSAGQSAVLFCPPLGEAQQLAYLLQQAELPIQAHRRISAMCRAYHKAGAALRTVPRFRGPPASPVALLWPTTLRRSRSLSQLPEARTALVSGLALDPEVRSYMECDGAFALSCHADYAGLLEYVRACKPSHVILVGGAPDDLHADLCGLGMEVDMLASKQQMELF